MAAELTPSPARTWRPPFETGDHAPWFHAATPARAKFHFSTVTSRYLLLGFLPQPGPDRQKALEVFQAHRSLFDDDRLCAFMVLRDEESIARARNQPPGLRWFFD